MYFRIIYGNNIRMNKFAERLTETMRAINITKAELARRVGISEDMVYDYCKGRGNPSLDILILICNELDETSDYLIGRTNS